MVSKTTTTVNGEVRKTLTGKWANVSSKDVCLVLRRMQSKTSLTGRDVTLIFKKQLALIFLHIIDF